MNNPMNLMSETMIYHVIPTGIRWKLICEGGEPTYHTTEAEAVAIARRQAMSNDSSHLVIHKSDGSIEEEYRLRMGSFHATVMETKEAP
jgi:hypothetical protein